MFPPAKKPTGPGGPPDPFAPPAGAGPGPGGPPDPFAAGPPPMPVGPGGPPDPFGGAPLGMTPGMPGPGQGMDPMQAMNGGIGAGPDPSMTGGAPAQDLGPPMGPDGFPVGGSMPPPSPDGGMGDMGGSALLQALAGGGAPQGGDPYAVGPLDAQNAFQGIGGGDPNMGQQQLLQMLALAQMGVGGGAGPGSSGADPGGNNIGSSMPGC